MSVLSLVELYERYIRPLSPADRLRLVTMTTHDLVQSPIGDAGESPRSIKELHGLGAETWKDVEAQEYVDSIRDEWDRP